MRLEQPALRKSSGPAGLWQVKHLGPNSLGKEGPRGQDWGERDQGEQRAAASDCDTCCAACPHKQTEVEVASATTHWSLCNFYHLVTEVLYDTQCPFRENPQEVNISPSGPGKPLVFLNDWLVFTLKRKRIWLRGGANPLWPPSKDARHLFPALAHPDRIILFSPLPLRFSTSLFHGLIS